MNFADRNVEYRLSYLQTLFNPVGGMAQVSLGLLCAFCGYISLMAAPGDSGLGLLAAVLFFMSALLLLYRSPKRRSLRTLAFTRTGVVFDFGDCVAGGTKQRGHGTPYRSLTVHRGLAGVSVLKSLSGHCVVVPESAIPRLELKQLLEKGKAEQRVGSAAPSKEHDS